MRSGSRDPVLFVGILGTLLVHGGIFGGLWLSRARAATAKGPALITFVDAQLVKFGKPRDLSFLPHKDGVMKQTAPPETLRVARDIDEKPTTPTDERPAEVDPLKKTRAEIFKQMVDDERPPAPTEVGGSMNGSRAGTASEAKGDPYILALIDRIGSNWKVPTTIKDAELRDLSADVCLTITESGLLSHYAFTRNSGSSQFDSSLEATLGTITSLPAPPAQLRSVAARGRLCATFATFEKK